MKKVYLLLLACLAINLKAQDRDTSNFRLGFGIRVNTFMASDLWQNNQPPVRLILNYDFFKYVRFEFQYGFAKNTVEKQYQVFNGDYKSVSLSDRTASYSLGLFLRSNGSKVNLYTGFRFGRTRYDKDDFYADTSGIYHPLTGHGDVLAFSGVLGGEYFFMKHFSVGGEFSYISLTDRFQAGAPSSALKVPPPTTSTHGITETCLILRFYL